MTTLFADTPIGQQYLSRFGGQYASKPMPANALGGSGAMGPGGVNTLDKYNQNKQFMLQQQAAGTAKPEHLAWLEANGLLQQPGASPGAQPGVSPAVQPGATALQPTGQPPAETGLRGATSAINQRYGGAIDTMRDATGTAKGDVTGYAQKGIDVLNPYATAGVDARELQSALSGALGPEAQAEAFKNYQESPEQAYLREQTERGVTRNAAALGGLGGGNVMKELQRNAMGLASTDYANSFNRLGTLAEQGLAATGRQADIYGDTGRTIGDMELTGGMKVADLKSGAGDIIAGLRFDAGKDIATNIRDTSTSLAELLASGGIDIGETIASGGGNIANLLAGSGLNQQQADQVLASLYANIATGSGTTIAGLPGIPGIQETGGALSDIGAVLGGAGAFMKGARTPKAGG